MVLLKLPAVKNKVEVYTKIYKSVVCCVIVKTITMMIKLFKISIK